MYLQIIVLYCLSAQEINLPIPRLEDTMRSLTSSLARWSTIFDWQAHASVKSDDLGPSACYLCVLEVHHEEYMSCNISLISYGGVFSRGIEGRSTYNSKGSES